MYLCLQINGSALFFSFPMWIPLGILNFRKKPTNHKKLQMTLF